MGCASSKETGAEPAPLASNIGAPPTPVSQLTSDKPPAVEKAVVVKLTDADRDRLLAADEARLRTQIAEELPEGSQWAKCGGTELEPLLVFTDLIDAAWLLKFLKGEVMPERKGIVPPWQLVPPEAKVSLATLRRSTMTLCLPVCVLSYGWAAQNHPDPTGALLRRLKPVLEMMVRTCQQGDSQYSPEERPAAWGILWECVHRHMPPTTQRPPALTHSCAQSSLTPHARIPLVCSFMSLPQRGYTTGYDPDVDDRTPYQLARFDKGLRGTSPRLTHRGPPCTCHHRVCALATHALAVRALSCVCAGVQASTSGTARSTRIRSCAIFRCPPVPSTLRASSLAAGVSPSAA